jgi:phenylalanine-4-hydroxylase
VNHRTIVGALTRNSPGEVTHALRDQIRRLDTLDLTIAVLRTPHRMSTAREN